MRRRDLIRLVGGAVVWPLAARAQQSERIRRIAVLMGWSETPIYRSSIEAFVQGLAQLGWEESRKIQIDVRWANGDVGRIRTLAKELERISAGLNRDSPEDLDRRIWWH